LLTERDGTPLRIYTLDRAIAVALSKLAEAE